MYASSTHAADYIARRERLGIFQPKPVVIRRPPEPKVEPKPRPRDVINITKPVRDRRVPEIIDIGDGLCLPPTPRWRDIAKETCERHGITFIDLCSARRDVKTVAARAEACWRMRHETTLSLPQIGKRLGGRDHTTILHNIRRFEAKLNGGEYRKYPLKVITANIKGDENENMV